LIWAGTTSSDAPRSATSASKNTPSAGAGPLRYQPGLQDLPQRPSRKASCLLLELFARRGISTPEASETSRREHDGLSAGDVDTQVPQLYTICRGLATRDSHPEPVARTASVRTRVRPPAGPAPSKAAICLFAGPRASPQ
jgi:hypothetical protein